MDRAGEKLRQARERLKLTYRDVADASQQIAARRGNPDFNIPLSRLADIENRGRIPTIFRLYTLCAIYHLDLHQVMGWYGVPVDLLAAEALQVQLAETHKVDVTPNGHASVPLPVEADIDPNKTTFLSQLIRRWGKVPLSFIEGLDLQHYRYGLVGLQDWSMFPVLRPGALVLIDETQRKVAAGGWTDEFDRPIYFLEHRQGYLCGWCAMESGNLVVLYHPASQKRPAIFRYPSDIEILGQVVGVAMLLDAKKRRFVRTSSESTQSPGLTGTAGAPPRARKAE
jgi:transcriptional regulator with XRE-family HTH domain